MENEIAYTVSDNCTYDELYLFIEQVESDFSPRLFGRIDAKAFILRVLNNATIITCRRRGELIGALFFYANDLLKKEAYITFLAISKLWRGCHIASRLLQSASKEAKSKGMTKICVSTCNLSVKKFYLNNGFEEDREEFDSHAQTSRFYLVKGL